ncbi:MAG: hypothetical protein ACX94C_07905 [Phycisphaerales bacterium]
MKHPLSEIINQKRNGDDPFTRTTITNAEAIEAASELDRLHLLEARVQEILRQPGLPAYAALDAIHAAMGKAASS